MPDAVALERDTGSFLRLLDDGDRELFMETARDAHSDVEIWTLALILGYRGTMAELIRWVSDLFPVVDRRSTLLSEVEKIKLDLESVRADIRAGLDESDGRQLYARVAQLTKELRSHLVEVEKMTRIQDRRGLVMTGAEKVVRELRMVFRDDPEMGEALDLALRAAWASLQED